MLHGVKAASFLGKKNWCHSITMLQCLVFKQPLEAENQKNKRGNNYKAGKIFEKFPPFCHFSGTVP